MAYLYVKSGGTKTTGTDTQKTGSWASAMPATTDYYGSIATAAGQASAGDIICVSDVTTVTENGDSFPTGVYTIVMSVDDDNVDQYSTTRPTWQNAGNFAFYGKFVAISLKITNANDPNYTAKGAIFIDCEIDTSKGWYNYPLDDGTSIRFINCIISSGRGTFMRRGAKCEVIGGTFTTTNPSLYPIVAGEFVDAGGTLHFIDCDMSAWSHASAIIVDGVGSNYSVDDYMDIRLINCAIGTFSQFHNENFATHNKTLLVQGCGSGTAAEYQYYFHSYGGSVEDETSVYRNDTIAFPRTSQKVSLKVDTSTFAVVNQGKPFFFDMPARYADASVTAEDTLTIYFASNSSLDDGDIAFEVYYPNSTNPHKRTLVRSTTSWFDPLRTPGSLTSDGSSTWTGSPTNKYKVDLSLSSGEEGVPNVRCYVTGQTTIYIDPVVVLS